MKQLSLTAMLILCLGALATHAQTSKVLLDNDKVKITEYTSKPGEDVCGKGNHSHGNHATILLTDTHVKTIEADNSEVMETYLADKHLYTAVKNGKTETMNTDGTFWAKGTTHTVTNVGNKVLRFYIVETK